MKRYLTTTLPYVNAAPHIGFALEIVQADALVRYWRSLGDEVFFNTGTDEHGVKIYEKALSEGKDVQAYVDEYAAKFKELMRVLSIDEHVFIRTTDPHHVAAAQEFWRRCAANGDIYLASYKAKYCNGCELEKTDSELVDGKCPLHPNLTLEIREEENYFFHWSKYQQPLLDLYAKYPDFVLPEHRLSEIRNFVSGGLQDFSISRLKEKMPWGIPVPGDEKHVMYVWFDALANYITTLGWPEDEGKFADFWGTREEPKAVQLAGKDNLRQQSAMWQAMLMSAGLPTSRRILIHGFITSGGEKMSKSLGNVVDPFEVAEKYGVDALRFWLLKEMPTFDDGDFTWERFKESYNAHLANGLGNLASRILKMAVTNSCFPEVPGRKKVWQSDLSAEIPKDIENFDLKKYMEGIWTSVQALDFHIQKTEPFKLVKTDPEGAKRIIAELAEKLWYIGVMLEPMLPSTSGKICSAIENKTEAGILFPRIS